MLTKDEMAEAMNEVRTLIFKIMDKHEQEAHDGAPCMSNRASAIAFLCHALGVRGTVFGYAETLLAEYDADCADLNCRHGKGQLP